VPTAEHLVLDLDGAQVTRPDAEERQPGRRLILVRANLEGAVGQAGGPEFLPGRMQELLPRLGPGGVCPNAAVSERRRSR